MIADHFIEAAGHIKASIDALETAKRDRVAVVAELESRAAPLKSEIASIEARIQGHRKALDALRSVPGPVSLGNRVRQWLGMSPVAPPATSVTIPPPASEIPPAPEKQTFAEIVSAADASQKMTPREEALKRREETA